MLPARSENCFHTRVCGRTLTSGLLAIASKTWTNGLPWPAAKPGLVARIGEGSTKGGEYRHGIIWNGDPWHKSFSPYLFRLEESMAIWREIRCPVLWVAGRQSWMVKDFEQRPGDWEARRACFADVEEAWIDQADHMLHHDQPEQVAQLIENFLGPAD